MTAPAIRRQLNAIVARRDGKPVTALERVVQLMEIGNYLEPALRQVGINKSSAYRWFEMAARAEAATTAAKEAGTTYKLSPDERAAIEWRAAVWDAEARGQSHLLAILEQESRGGLEVKTVTEKTLPDGSVERTERIEYTRPNVAAITWRLERRHPELWGRRRIELSGPDGGAIPVEGRAAALADDLERLLSAAETNGHTNGHAAEV